jgi:hypothetical protein
MEKHKNIPVGAIWNAEENQWNVIGRKNEAGKEIGIWEDWHVDGYRCALADFGDGTLPFHFKRFHPDGTFAQEGFCLGGDRWVGTYRWVKSDNPTTELFPPIAKDNAAIWCMEFDYTESEGVINTQRYYDKARRPLTVWGDPLPERPATVPAQAYCVQTLSSAHGRGWVMGQLTVAGKFIGDYAEWDMNGVLCAERVYHMETGTLVESYEYERGKLWSSSLYSSPDDFIKRYYHRNIDPPVVHASTSYRNQKKDWTETIHDTTGKLLYTTRHETVNDLHERKYYNDRLIYEGIRSLNKKQGPSRYLYYRPDGSILIDYISQGDDTGLWRMHEETGKEMLILAQHDEARMEKDGDGDRFMPIGDDAAQHKPLDRWQAVVENFKTAYKTFLIDQTISSLPFPPYLNTELKKVRWASVKHAMHSAEGLPLAINGFLSENADVVTESSKRIWLEIEHQGSIYDATYRVSTILANILPHYASNPTIHRRLPEFLFNVLRLEYIKSSKRYSALITAIAPSLSIIQSLAMDADDTLALKCQFILLEAGHTAPETKQFFIREWHALSNPPIRRAYAAFALNHLYIYTKQQTKLISTYADALEKESVPLVRLVIAMSLVAATREEAQDAWLAELIPALSKPAGVDDAFYKLQPFIGDADADEYILTILSFAKGDVLERNIEPIIDALPGSTIFKQETLLRAIFSVLFNTKHAQKNITPMRKKALLIAAEVVDAHVTLVTHSEIFEEFSLPYDASKLRKLAEKSYS